MTPEATLVLLPGLDGTDAMFAPLLESLPPWICPVVVTYPASGPNGYDDLLPLVQRAVTRTSPPARRRCSTWPARATGSFRVTISTTSAPQRAGARW